MQSIIMKMCIFKAKAKLQIALNVDFVKKLCPQHLEIRKLLKDVAKEFGK